jgi:TonB family protein
MRASAATAALLVLMAGGASSAAAQSLPDLLSTARDLYANAVYEDALAVLARAGDPPAGSPPSLKRDLEVTRALCLVALGREDEARSAMEAAVDADPAFDLKESEAAPRVRELLRQARVKQLPAIVRARYAAAKEAFDAHDYATAATRFALVDTLLRDPVFEAAGGTEYSDLRTLVAGFRELSTQRQAAAGAAPGTPAPGTAPGGAKGTPTPTGDARAGTTGAGAPPRPTGTSGQSRAGAPRATSPAGAPAQEPGPRPKTASAEVVPPVAIEQQAPAWSPSLGLAPGRVYKATVEVMVDATGRVSSARIVESVNKAYDERLLAAVRRWRYRPGTRGGVPIPFRTVVSVTVESP